MLLDCEVVALGRLAVEGSAKAEYFATQRE